MSRSARFPSVRATASAVAARAVVAVAVAALVAAACGPSGPIRATIPESALADAAWETAWDPSELTDDVVGRIQQPAIPRTPEHPFDPCPGATVEVLVPRPEGTFPLTVVATGTTAADGTFRLGKTPPGTFVVRVRKPGFAQSIGSVGVVAPGAVELGGREVIGLGVHDSTTLRGRVVDRSGRGVPDVVVGSMVLAHHDETRTAADGSFSIVTPAGRAVLTILDPRWDVVRRPVEYDPASPAPLVVETAAVAPYAGIVVAAEDDRPIEGAVVVSLADTTRRTTTDALGRFVLPIPREGRVAAFAAGRAWRSHVVPRVADEQFRLHAAAGVAGRVVDADGRPVEGARLLAVAENLDGVVDRVLGPVTDRDGRFDFSWLPPTPRGARQTTTLVAWHRRRGLSQALAMPATAPVELRLTGWRDATGFVADHGGRPVPGALVRADWTGDPLDEAALAHLRVPRSRAAVTAADGTWRLAALPTDRAVALRADVFGLQVVESLAPGTASRAIRFALPEGRSLSGVVTDAKGRPVADATVTLRLLDTPGVVLDRTLVTGADGAFRSDDLPVGRYEVRADSSEFAAPTSAEARPGEAPVRLVLERPARLTLRFEFVGVREGEPLPSLTATVEDIAAPHAPGRRIPIDAAKVGGPNVVGEFHSGQWRVRVAGAEWRGLVDPVDLADSEVREVTVRMERTLRLRAVLRDGRGEPMSGQPVLLLPVQGTAGQPVTVWSADGGIVDTAGLLPGRWELRVAPANEAPLTTTITVPAAESVELRLPPSGEVTVRIRRADGEAVAGAIVALAAPDGAAVYAWSEETPQLSSRFRTATDGTVRIRGVATGRVRVEAAAGAARFAAKEIDVRAGAPVEVVWP